MRIHLHDLRFAVRMLAKSPGFLLVAVLSLALGVGGVTTIFSVLKPAVLRPLSFEDPDRLVILWETRAEEGRIEELLPKFSTFLAWKEQSKAFEQMAMANFQPFNRVWSVEDGWEASRGQQVGPDLMRLLRVKPILGRTFLPEDFTQGDMADTVVISRSYWQRRFGGDPNIVGKLLRARPRSWTIIGVVPDFHVYPWIDKLDYWQSWDVSRRADQRRFPFIGRLKPGVSIEQAEAELEGIRRGLESSEPRLTTPSEVKVQPLGEYIAGKYSEALYLLFGAVGFVLLIACVNLANLMLGRASDREKEIATRVALGAGRGRLTRQLLTESLLLSVLGGGLGIVLALWGVQLFVALSPDFYPADEIHLDDMVFGFALAISVLTGLVVGIAPAFRACRVDPQESLRDGTRGSPGAKSLRARRFLVVSEIALALVLLAGAGLTLKTFVRVLAIDLGFESDGVLVMDIHVGGVRYGARLKSDDHRVTPQVALFYEELLDSIRGLPGVESAGMISWLPPQAPRQHHFHILGRAVPPPDEEPLADYNEVDENFFETMGIPLFSGRFFERQDSQDAAGVAIISETFSRRLFPNDDPIGHLLQPAFRRNTGRSIQDRPRRIVGVVGDIRHRVRSEPVPAIYVPYRQNLFAYPGTSRQHRGKSVVIRTASDPIGLAAALRRTVSEIDKDQAPSSIATLEQILSEEVGEERFWMRLFGLFAALAVFLAAVGLYGIVSYSVAQRTREFGLRMALGAEQTKVLKLVGREVLALSLGGIAVGVVAALALTPLMASQLFGVGAADPATFVIVSLVLIGVALLSCYLPARRATRVDPGVALRYE